MPRGSQIALTAKNHEDGNLPRTTAFETAVRPTLAASAMSRRPTASAKRVAALSSCVSEVDVMADQYPQFVEDGKPTIRGLKQGLGWPIASTVRELVLMYEDVGNRLRLIREHFSDLSQKAWAENHGFNVTQYNNWEKGVRRIPVEAAEKLCETYGITLDWMYRGKRDGLSETFRKSI
jgi:transcriptional regulator with XRE-family HTH domain